MQSAASLPRWFCWTRFGTEAGQAIEDILRRKEEERLANGGIFLWGVGNAVGPSITELTQRVEAPEVVFSPTRKAPGIEHRSPSGVLAWTGARTFDGKPYSLPARSLVTSRDSTPRRKSVHYALVCFSPQPLSTQGCGTSVDLNDLKNLRTGRQVGASQVTAVVELSGHGTALSRSAYPVAFTALLVPPYFIHLHGPVPLVRDAAVDGWSTVVSQVWDSRNDGTLDRLLQSPSPRGGVVL